MRIQVTFEMDEDDPLADPTHEMGITAECYELLVLLIPGYDIEVERIEEDE